MYYCFLLLISIPKLDKFEILGFRNRLKSSSVLYLLAVTRRTYLEKLIPAALFLNPRDL